MQINEQCCVWENHGNLRRKIDVKLVTSETDYLERTSIPSYMPQKLFDNNVVAIHKSKVMLKLNKPAYVGFVH